MKGVSSSVLDIWGSIRFKPAYYVPQGLGNVYVEIRTIKTNNIFFHKGLDKEKL